MIAALVRTGIEIAFAADIPVYAFAEEFKAPVNVDFKRGHSAVIEIDVRAPNPGIKAAGVLIVEAALHSRVLVALGDTAKYVVADHVPSAGECGGWLVSVPR